MQARVDMHCHSLYSDRPAHWIFYKLGGRESYTNPEELYQQLKARGMSFVTITDHNTIEGALQIAEAHDDAFVSCEFTVRFYREVAEAHVCVYDLTEQEYREAMRLCHDMRAFAEFFRDRNRLAVVSHPVHAYRGRCELGHLEQMTLLFEHFEEINGLQADQTLAIQKAFLDGLTPQAIEAMAKRHGIQPAFEVAWEKGRTGGSDDHFGFFAGRCWTEVPDADTVAGFLDGIRAKHATAHGQSLNAMEFAHAMQFNVLHALMDPDGPPPSMNERLDRIVSWIRQKPAGKPDNVDPEKPELIPPFFVESLVENWSDPETLINREDGEGMQEETFTLVDTVFNTLVHDALRRFSERFQGGRLVDALRELALLAPAAAIAAPYVMGYRHFHSDQTLCKRVAEKYGFDEQIQSPPAKWAWFSDTVTDINGVTRIIERFSAQAEEQGVPIVPVTSHPDDTACAGVGGVNFPPLHHIAMPEYESMIVAVPPLLDLLRFCEQEQFTRFIISTPGPTGLVALWIARILGIETWGIYHTNLPEYVRRLTRDPGMEHLAWKLVKMLYGNVDRLFTLSDASAEQLQRHGVAEKDIQRFPKGTDIDLFHPGRRDTGIWNRWNLGDRIKILYVGRISPEKDLDVLEFAYRRLCESHAKADLVLVGDGPALAEMKTRMADLDQVRFLGFVEGSELADLYASADIFAFPSTTDTYGSVVLEAQASGLPVVVSDAGGPREAMLPGESGLVTEAGNPVSFAEALSTLIQDPALRKTMGTKGRQFAGERTWDQAWARFTREPPA